METKAGAQISRRAFTQALAVLLALMVAAGVLTRSIPAGEYTRLLVDGREMIDPGSYTEAPRPDYPVWRWFTAPLEVLGGPDSALIITIIIFLLMVGVSFAVLDRSGLLRAGIERITRRFEGRKYLLLLAISLFFMLLGAFLGIFEEVVPLVPLMVALSYALGWDALVGLGMSILATNMGFSAAIANPFTIGIAQQIAGLPLFSGAWFRVPIFLAVFVIYAVFLVAYARRVERDPQRSLTYTEDLAARRRHAEMATAQPGLPPQRFKAAATWVGVFLGLILLTLVGGPLVEGLADFALPLVGLLFFFGGVGAGAVAGLSRRELLRLVGQGAAGIAPAVPLILMAASVKHIIASGGIMDTLLQRAAAAFPPSGAYPAALSIFGLTLGIEFFISSGSAKAFLVMPILLPIADLVGVTRQVAVTAYCFGDGFSNMLYPTSAVLLISLGLTPVSYAQWLRWTLPIALAVLAVSAFFLWVGVAVELGPF
jgi:uncharacterized ion transporter superfamily protein YfcC